MKISKFRITYTDSPTTQVPKQVCWIKARTENEAENLFDERYATDDTTVLSIKWVSYS